MHLRGLVLLLLCLAGCARRSMRFNNSHQGVRRQNSTLANGLEVSAEAREALIPGAFWTDTFRRAGPQTTALSKESKYRAAPLFRRSRFGPRRAKANIANLGMTGTTKRRRQQKPESWLPRQVLTGATRTLLSRQPPVETLGSYAPSLESKKSRLALISMKYTSNGEADSGSHNRLSDQAGAVKRKPNGPEGIPSAASSNPREVRSSALPVNSSVAGNDGNYQLDPQRWTQLLLLSLLALISDLVCFSTVAVPDTWALVEGHAASQLIDIFLLSNVLSCFLYTDIAATFGLRRVLTFAAFLMAAGCGLRSSAPTFDMPTPAGVEVGLPGYSAEVIGTILVGLAQPYFQCAPPQLSATWFGSSERALATATALNANQLGIGTAFIVGGLMANTPMGMEKYLDLITGLASTAAIATAVLFRDRPLTPPSASAAAAWEAEEAARESNGVDGKPFELTYPKKALALVRNEGFLLALAVFVASIGTTNVVSAFTASELARAGFPSGFRVDLAGAAFQAAIVFGGIGLGRYVDKTKQFKTVLLGCLITSIGLLGGLGVLEGDDTNLGPLPVLTLLLALGAAVGPVQPIAAELAVEVTYPCDENAVEATQQLAGNLFSAFLVPLCEAAATLGWEPFPEQVQVRGDTLVLSSLVALTAIYFAGFDAPLSRSLLDEASEEKNGGTAAEPNRTNVPR